MSAEFTPDSNAVYRVSVTDMAGNTYTEDVNVLWLDIEEPQHVTEKGHVNGMDMTVGGIFGKFVIRFT